MTKRRTIALLLAFALIFASGSAALAANAPENNVVWYGQTDTQVAQFPESGWFGSDRTNASGEKITSNAHSTDVGSMYFRWADKQNVDTYLKVESCVFDKWESFVLTAKTTKDYYDITIKPVEGQELTSDGCYVFYLPRIIEKGKKGDEYFVINMVFFGGYTEKETGTDHEHTPGACNCCPEVTITTEDTYEAGSLNVVSQEGLPVTNLTYLLSGGDNGDYNEAVSGTSVAAKADNYGEYHNGIKYDPDIWVNELSKDPDYARLQEMGAQLIWESEVVKNPTHGDLVSFSHDFTIPGAQVTDQSVVFAAAADNAWAAYLNGTFIGSAETAFKWGNITSFPENEDVAEIANVFENGLGEDQVSYDEWKNIEFITIPGELIRAGGNTLTVYGLNEYYHPEDNEFHEHPGCVACNPAFMFYGMTVNYHTIIPGEPQTVKDCSCLSSETEESGYKLTCCSCCTCEACGNGETAKEMELGVNCVNSEDCNSEFCGLEGFDCEDCCENNVICTDVDCPLGMYNVPNCDCEK